MRETKKLALSALLVGLGTVFMVIGSFVEVLDLAVCALASVIVMFAYIELGSPYTWLVWLATSMCTGVLGGILWVEYLLIFGFYPILKAYIERLRRGAWIPLKLVFANIACVLIHFLSKLIMGHSLFDAESKLLQILTVVIMNAAMIAYDYFLTVMVRFYFDRIRGRVNKFLK